MSTVLFDKFMKEVKEEGIAQGREQGIAIAVKNLGMTMEEYKRRIKE